jgi:O-antigen/teichoic acid export membrane protein
MLLLILLAPVISDEVLLVTGLQISAPLIVIGPFVSLFSAIFRARRVMWPLAALNLGMLALQLIVTLLALAADADLLALLAINLLTSAGQLLAAWGIYRLRFYVTNDGVETRRAVSLPVYSLLRRAAPFAVAAILGALQLRLSVILLEQVAGAAVTGQYAAASRFVEAGRMLPQALFVALFPALAALRQNPSAMQQRLSRIMRWLTLYGVAFGLAMFMIGPLLVTLTYGPRFDEASRLLPLLGWTLLPAGLKGCRALYCYASGYESFANRMTALALVLQVGLSLWGISQFGAAGLALALIVSETAALLLLWRQPKSAEH